MLNPDLAADQPRAIETTIRGGVALIALNRPGQINAINEEIRILLPQALAEFEEDDEARVIVLHGGSSRGFCAGADIKENRGAEAAFEVRDRNMRHAWIDAFDRVSKPVIAAVHGHCLGGGMEMALACDIRIASPDAVFALPETGLGLIPGAGGTQRLQRLIGHGRAIDMLLTGDRFDAHEAHRIGLVTRLASDRQKLLGEAIALAERIAARAPLATAYVKEAAKAAGDLTLAAGQVLERNLFALLSTTADKVEAARAFSEKRKPVFGGK